LDQEIKKLAVALSHEGRHSLKKILLQFNQIVAGTHHAVPIQAPEIKRNTKGRPSTKKTQSTSTKRNPSAFEVIEANLKKEQTTKKRALDSLEQSSKQMKKILTMKKQKEAVKKVKTMKEANTTMKSLYPSVKRRVF
jgi:hypothetical protein